MATKEKVVPQKLSREAYRALESVVGKEWVSGDRAIIEAYVLACIDVGTSIRALHRDPTLRAAAVVLPASTEEVQEVVKLANRYGFPIQPYSNSQVGSSCLAAGTVIVSMRRMDKIEVDEENMLMTVQPFINYMRIHHEAAKKSLWLGGSGWHGAIAKPCSQFSTAGLWQSELKYCGLSRNTLGMKVVMADGSLLRLGSSAIAGTGDTPFTERFPGPNLMGIMKDAFGSRGIITEITLKLHPWVGSDIPEDRGRPCVEHYFEDAEEKKFDRPPTPAGHKIFWFDYPDLEGITNGVAALANSGIGVALNVCGNYNAAMCSYTIAEANKRSEERYFGFSGYMVIAGIWSEKQLDYEEKVLRHIVEETGGKLWSAEYKPELLDAVAPWSVEFVLNTETGLRTLRSNYIDSMLTPYARFREIPDTSRLWEETYNEVGTLGEERGEYFSHMGTWCPYGYIADRGHQVETEVDYFPERTNEKELITMFEGMADSIYRYMANKYPSSWMEDLLEPFPPMMPEVGPDRYLLLRKYREITDPKGVISPLRLATTGDEFKARYIDPKEPTVKMALRLRERFGFPKLELAPEGDRWKPTE